MRTSALQTPQPASNTPPPPEPPPVGHRRLRLALGWGAVALLAGHASYQGGLAFDLMTAVMWAVSVVTDAAGVPFHLDWFGMSHRLAAVALGAGIAVATLRYQRRSRGACPRCGRHGHAARRDLTWLIRPASIVAAVPAIGYLALKLHWGFGGTLGLRDPAVFAGVKPWSPGMGDTAVMALIGVLVTFAMAYQRPRLPRWLLLAPALIGCLLLLPVGGISTGYLLLVWLSGDHSAFHGDLAAWVVIAVYPSFLIWGVGLAVVTVGFYFQTRRSCRRCGRG
ncbi:hypothetical protein JQS43_17810 [Natronosporangium hydrolyticum]|uniref:Uncharacterized protein n=1 Tax=Natronosporangium hydrolyticum TaxID=2811111 RepID=A0A895Y6S4_9ACTN|nr:hypothetical protein [Natronosporangium hydrolyticum]QSB13447.1 hypothetical protein JQS43_17810 [Natronosporangium hydrolyticum]